jgi:hypothetical protein
MTLKASRAGGGERQVAIDGRSGRLKAGLCLPRPGASHIFQARKGRCATPRNLCAGRDDCKRLRHNGKPPAARHRQIASHGPHRIGHAIRFSLQERRYAGAREPGATNGVDAWPSMRQQ